MPWRIVTELGEDLGSPRFLPAISTGLVMGILCVIISISFASMIFSGPLSDMALRGAGLTLWGTALLCLIAALGSRYRSIIGIAQDSPTAIMSTMAASLAAAMADTAAPDVRFMTVTATMAMATMASGAAFVLIGRYRLANLLRYMPYPVVGGFLAGTGWLLAMGSISVMCGVSPTPSTLQQLATPAMAAKWLPGVIYGALLFAAMLRWGHFMLLPGSLLLVMALFYAGLGITGMSVDAAKAAGLLVSGLPAGGLFPVFLPHDLVHIDWGLVWGQLPGIMTIVLVTAVGTLLNMSGIELGTGAETDMNREFSVNGVANLAAGAGGAISGYPALSMSLLGFKAGADSRWAGLTATMVVAGVLFAGGHALEYFPKAMLGGLILLLGLFFIHEWIIDARKKLPRTDYAIVLSIFVVVMLFGFLEGVAFGLVTTVIFFVVRFSRVPVVAATFTAARRRSCKQRPIPHRKILSAKGHCLVGYQLTGYLFFGSAATVVATMKAVLDDAPGTEAFIIDLENISGFDISAVNHFNRFVVNAANNGTSVVFTAAPQRFEAALRAHLAAAAAASVSFASDLDRGLEWCEERIIAEALEDTATSQDHRDALFNRSVDDVIAQLERQERFETLLERLAPWLEYREFEDGAVIMAKGAPLRAVHFIVSGEAINTDPDTDTRLGTLVPGDVVGITGAFGSAAAGSTVTAAGGCEVALLTPTARGLLEQEDPETAIGLHGYVIQKLTA